jgi:hypothetical protein
MSQDAVNLAWRRRDVDRSLTPTIEKRPESVDSESRRRRKFSDFWSNNGGGGKNELNCSFSLGKVVEAAGVETRIGRFSNLLMARDF